MRPSLMCPSRSVPHDDEGPCDLCGNAVDNCKCPECRECGSVGDPRCYQEHGLPFTQQQLLSRCERLEFDLSQMAFVEWEQEYGYAPSSMREEAFWASRE